jgi:hypothetical protein
VVVPNLFIVMNIGHVVASNGGLIGFEFSPPNKLHGATFHYLLN